MPTPSKPRPLSDPAVMLETLKLAHQFTLDRSVMHMDGTLPTRDTKRLSPAREKELGRRLARYWLMEDPTAPLITEDELNEVVDQVTEAAQKAWAAVVGAAGTVKQRVEKRR